MLNRHTGTHTHTNTPELPKSDNILDPLNTTWFQSWCFRTSDDNQAKATHDSWGLSASLNSLSCSALSVVQSRWTAQATSEKQSGNNTTKDSLKVQKLLKD